MDETGIEAFWSLARRQARLSTLPGYFGPSTLEVVTPPAWSFGGEPEQADRLLQLVLDGTKTATASAREDYDLDVGPLPVPGSLGILLDSRGRPRALVATTAVEVVPFDQVSEDHAYAEGEGDRTLAGWRADHEELGPDKPVVLERFTVLYAP